MASCKLVNIPADVFKLVIQEQSKIKESKGTKQWSFERTVYKMIRDYDKCRNINNFKPEE